MGILLLDSTVIQTPRSAEAYADMFMSLLPPGKLWRWAGSLLRDLLLACGDGFVRFDARVADLLNESDPTTALELLPEYERELKLDPAASTDERQARIVARLVARQRFRPVDFQQALAPLLALAPADVQVLERTRAFVTSIGDDREIFRFFVYRDPSLPGTPFIASAQALVDTIKPSHTVGTVIESTSALYDDPHSLYDRDLLGA